MTTFDDATLPKTYESAITKTETVSMGFSGSVSAGCKKTTTGAGASASISLTANYSTSKSITYEIQDVTVQNQRMENKRLGWIYNINNWPSVNYGAGCTALSKVKEGAEAGRSTIDKTTMFLIKVDDSNLNKFPKLKLYLNVVLGSTGAKAEHERGSREMFVAESAEFELPYAVKDDTNKETHCKYYFPEDDKDHTKTKIPKKVDKKSEDNNPKSGYYTIQKRKKQWSDF